MTELGFNYRLTDLQCALGRSRLRHLEKRVHRRAELAARYDAALARVNGVMPLRQRCGVRHAYHLYVVRIHSGARDRAFSALRAAGIGANVHYVPVHLHPFYRQRFGTGNGLCPEAEAAYGEILSLPMFPAMREADVDRVVGALADATSA